MYTDKIKRCMLRPVDPSGMKEQRSWVLEDIETRTSWKLSRPLWILSVLINGFFETLQLNLLCLFSWDSIQAWILTFQLRIKSAIKFIEQKMKSIK